MRTALDARREDLDDDEREFVDAIREDGWFRTGVLGEGKHPAFSYTTGFWLKFQAPEVLIHSLRDDIAHDVLWDIFRDLQSGWRPALGQPTDGVLGNLRVCFFRVDRRRYDDHLGWSRWFYRGGDFECVQLVWPDRGGAFPWQDGFDPKFRNDQVDLSVGGWMNKLRR